MLYVILSLFTLFTVQAQSDIDQRLSGYIEKFNLKPLSKPTDVNPDLARLGHGLFTDRVLSGNDNISCMECHHPANMTMDNLPLALGEGSEGIQIAGERRTQKNGTIQPRNTPGLFNLNGVNVMFWDGRVSFNPETKEFTTPVVLDPAIANTMRSALAAQALFPMVNHGEMRGKKGTNAIANAKNEHEAWDLILAKVLKNERYKRAFEKLYPNQKINIGHVAEAIAEFQRSTFFFADTAYDNYLAGDVKALNEVQKMGMEVFFNKGRCGECHQGEHLSNFEFHSVGAPQIGPGKINGDDLGRFEFDQSEGNRYAFRVPPLRNVSLTPPYMHDGSFKTLPQVVEHYDMVVESFSEFNLVNNWKSYVDSIANHNHENDELRKASLSKKITPRLNFTEEEEKALSEFLLTAITDKKLLAREIDGNYETYFRLQLRPSGFEKLARKFDGEKDTEVFYYFDTLLEGGYYLREIAEPIRLIVVKSKKGAEIIYREQAHKLAVAQNGVVLGGQFNREEKRLVSDDVFAPLEAAYLDMFNRIYTYNDGSKQEEIPATELSIIKSDVEEMNEQFHKISFSGAEHISDIMNQSKEEVFYVPTSYNTKETTTFTMMVEGRPVKAILQKSTLRNEKGGIETTWAIEFESTRTTKAQVESFAKQILEQLELEASDVGGGSPSPSVLTLDVLSKIIDI